MNWGAGWPWTEHIRVTLSPSFCTKASEGTSISGWPEVQREIYSEGGRERERYTAREGGRERGRVCVREI